MCNFTLHMFLILLSVISHFPPRSSPPFPAFKARKRQNCIYSKHFKNSWRSGCIGPEDGDTAHKTAQSPGRGAGPLLKNPYMSEEQLHKSDESL